MKGNAPTVGQYLFNNNNKVSSLEDCQIHNCLVCSNNIENKSGSVKSALKETEFKVQRGLTCNQGGIYLFEGACRSQYTGKTVSFGNRSIDHFRKGKMSSIKDHMKECRGCNSVKDFFGDICMLKIIYLVGNIVCLKGKCYGMKELRDKLMFRRH